MFGSAPFDDITVATVLRDEWGLAVEAIAYAAVGYGSYHWWVTAVGRRWFVTADGMDAPRPVVAAYELADRLAADGLGFVRAPHRAPDGRVVAPAGNWWLSVWPWIEGRTATDGRYERAEDLGGVLERLRLLHEHPVPEHESKLVDDLTLPGRSELLDVVDRLGDRTLDRKGPYAAETAARVADHAARLRADVARYDTIAEARATNPTPFVVTHGEPHAANVVHTADGPVLIDWDTARIAPRERDLWSLVGHDGWEQWYGDVDVSDDVVELYRLQWDLSEVADYAGPLLRADERTADLDVAFDAVRRLLP